MSDTLRTIAQAIRNKWQIGNNPVFGDGTSRDLQLLCEGYEQLERELNEAKNANTNANAAIGDIANECSRIAKDRDEWKACAEELADRLIKTVCSSDDESWKAFATFNQLKAKSK